MEVTDREKAIVMAYTGAVMLAGDKLEIYYKYLQEKLGRPVMTHELALHETHEAIREAVYDDFLELAKAEPVTCSTCKHSRKLGMGWFCFKIGSFIYGRCVPDGDWHCKDGEAKTNA